MKVSEDLPPVARIVLPVHYLAMAGLGFWSACLFLGGPFGFVPAQAALLREARGWGAARGFRPGVFGRIWHGAAAHWTQDGFSQAALTRKGLYDPPSVSSLAFLKNLSLIKIIVHEVTEKPTRINSTTFTTGPAS